MRDMRFQIVNPCKECFSHKAHCSDAKRCDPVRKSLRGYNGIRFTADGFDCALPVTIDSHSHCSFACEYCEPAGSKIMMSDGNWKNIEDIIIGDKLLGWSRKDNGRRAYEESTVEETFVRDAEIIELTTVSGSVLRCTPDHLWLSDRNEEQYEYAPARIGRPLIKMFNVILPLSESNDYKMGYIHGLVAGDGAITEKVYDYGGRQHHRYQIRVAMNDTKSLDRLEVYCCDLDIPTTRGESIYSAGKLPCVRMGSKETVDFVRSSLDSYEYKRGWLAGIFDAEGTISGTLRISQFENVNKSNFDKLIQYASDLGFKYKIDYKKSQQTRSGIRLVGGRDEVYRFLAVVQPASIESKFKKQFVGTNIKCLQDVVKDIKPIGTAKVYSIRTSTHNYIAQGYGSHNCFSDNLLGHRESSQKSDGIGQTSLKMIEGIFSGNGGKNSKLYRKALKYDDLSPNGYPCPVQLGGICDAGDNIERNQGWLLKFIKLAIKYEQPVRMSTKGNIFLDREYLDAIGERPDLFWVAYSIISPDDGLLSQIDKECPPPSERIECMQNLAGVGVTTSLRFRPILPGISDKTPKYDQAYQVLIDEAADAGAKAISYEVGFVPGALTPDMKARWDRIEKVSGVPIREIYKRFGKKQACTRPSYLWTEGIMHAIKERALHHKLWVGVSDPAWKQLTDHGCCCGIPEDHPVFGNWQRTQATNALKIAKDTGDEITLSDITPVWSYEAREDMLSCPATGPSAQYMRHHWMWSHELQRVWNSIDAERSPSNYFQGALLPSRLDSDRNVVYKYVGLQRHYKDAPYWSL